MSWYKQGDAGIEKAKEEDEKRQQDWDQPMRFWLKPDTSTKFAFIDSDGLIG